jgi:hypothetical protein
LRLILDWSSQPLALLRKVPSLCAREGVRSDVPPRIPRCKGTGRYSRWSLQCPSPTYRMLSRRVYLASLTGFQGIGVLAALLAHVEKHPTSSKITRDSTTFESLQCLAEHAPDMSQSLRNNVKRAAKSDKALKHVEREFLTTPFLRALTQTTQAMLVCSFPYLSPLIPFSDIINGGVKINALPEQVYAVINHRIATYRLVFSGSGSCGKADFLPL